MAFKKVSVAEEINKRLENDPELQLEYELAQRDYDVIKQLKELRKEKGLSQKEVANMSGLTQQMISRIEKIDNVPSLHNLNRYAYSMGAKLKVEKIGNS